MQGAFFYFFIFFYWRSYEEVETTNRRIIGMNGLQLPVLLIGDNGILCLGFEDICIAGFLMLVTS